MLAVRNSLALLVSIFLLASCTSTAEFPEQTGSVGSEEAAFEDGTVIIASAASEGSDELYAEEEGLVIVAASAKPDEEIMAKKARQKTKPILKSTAKRDVSKSFVGKQKDTSRLVADRELDKADIETDFVEAADAPKVVIKESEYVDVIVSAEPAQQAAVEPSITYQLDTFYFENGSSQIKASERKKIREIAKLAKEKKATLYVLGYSSSRTNDTDYVSHKMANFKVSLARAETVADALIKAGVPDDKVLLEALADSRPAFLEVMPEGERLNRRVEVYIGY